jgi:hypothetical protein
VRQGGRIFRALAWRAVERESFLGDHKGGLDLAFSLTENTFNGETRVELTMCDARVPEEVTVAATAGRNARSD